MKPIIIANWKMNPSTLPEAKVLFNAVTKGLKNVNGVETVICPPFVFISELRQANNSIVKLGGQNCFWENKGAFTGEISPKQLKNLGAEYVIIGHSERKRYLNETNEIVNKKLKAALGAGLKSVVCVGEEERGSSESAKEVRDQVKEIFSGIEENNFENIIITYEPIWAISTNHGGVATPEKAKEGSDLIRKSLAEIFNEKTGENAKIIYGGSVGSKNIESFIGQSQMAGALVGAASLRADEFVELIIKAGRFV